MTDVHYLTIQQALFIHKRIIDETGGARGVRDIGALQSSIARPQATFGKMPLFPSILGKAAALLHGIILNHPFVDGNKRTGLTAAALFLQINGWKLDTSHEELESFVLEIAIGRHDVGEIANWLRAHTQEI
jgi:death-on-curing protein